MAKQTKFLWAVAPPVIRAAGRLGFSLRIEHQASFPGGPCVVAVNHYSHLDPPVLAASLDTPVRFLALDDLFGPNRLLDWLIVGFGAIPTPRDVVPIRAVRTALEALDNNEVVAVFPEATRVSHWGVLPPKRGAAWLARQARVPLIPAAMIGTGRAMGLDNKIRRAKITVVVGAPIDPGSDDHETMKLWADWMDSQVARFPHSEIDGPRRAFHED